MQFLSVVRSVHLLFKPSQICCKSEKSLSSSEVLEKSLGSLFYFHRFVVFNKLFELLGTPACIKSEVCIEPCFIHLETYLVQSFH